MVNRKETERIDPEVLSEERSLYSETVTEAMKEAEPDGNMDEYREKITKVLHDAARRVAPQRRQKEPKISEETKKLMEERRQMKKQGICVASKEYRELCKTVRKKLRFEIRQYNTSKIEDTIKENKSL